MRVGGARPPRFTIFTITSKVAVCAPTERAETLPLFHLYPSVLCGVMYDNQTDYVQYWLPMPVFFLGVFTGCFGKMELGVLRGCYGKMELGALRGCYGKMELGVLRGCYGKMELGTLRGCNGKMELSVFR